MSDELIPKFTRTIVFLVIVILGLINFIVIDKLKKPQKEDAVIIDSVVDSASILMNSKANYRYSANFINADFDPERGRNIFDDKCAMCHSLHGSTIIGPPLVDVFHHIPTEPKDWIFHYLKNSDSLASTGDKYVKELREKYTVGKWNHTDSLLTKESLTDLIGFIGMMK